MSPHVDELASPSGAATIMLCDGPRRVFGRVLSEARGRITVDVCGVRVVVEISTGRLVSPGRLRWAPIAPQRRRG